MSINSVQRTALRAAADAERYASRSRLGSGHNPTIIDPMTSKALGRDEAVRRLVASETEIRGLGVQRLALFGSVLRGEAGPDSDVDVLVQFSPGAKTFEHFLALSDLLEELLGKQVELVTTEALSPFIGPRILADAQDVLRAA
jgi:predicted nucleotidyltransferase